MGFFADIAAEVCQGIARTQAPVPVRQDTPRTQGTTPVPQSTAHIQKSAPVPQNVAHAQEPIPVPQNVPHAQEPAPAPQSVPHAQEQVPVPQAPVPEQPVPEAVPLSAEPAQESPVPSEPPTIDLTPTANKEEETERRKAHEAAEAKRKAEFEARQAEKKAARQAQLDRLASMSDADIMEASIGRVSADTEKLTRRNMKEAVAEHIQEKCREDASFARLVMHPAKTMVNCFQFINRRAKAYAEQEMKDNGIARTGVYGLDVPDGLCYQWAEDYFNDPDVKEDHENDEKFVPKPYVPSAQKTSAAKTAKKKPEQKKPAAPKTGSAGFEQMSLPL